MSGKPERLQAFLHGHAMFSQVDAECRRTLFKEMVIDAGEVEEVCDTPRVIASGGTVADLALCHPFVAPASVVAKTDVRSWSLEGGIFRFITMNSNVARVSHLRDFFGSQPWLTGSSHAVSLLIDASSIVVLMQHERLRSSSAGSSSAGSSSTSSSGHEISGVNPSGPSLKRKAIVSPRTKTLSTEASHSGPVADPVSGGHVYIVECGKLRSTTSEPTDAEAKTSEATVFSVNDVCGALQSLAPLVIDLDLRASLDADNPTPRNNAECISETATVISIDVSVFASLAVDIVEQFVGHALL